MKKIFYLLSIVIFLIGCSDVLDIQPTNMISEEAVKNDPVLVDAFLNKIYANTRFQSRGVNNNYTPDEAMLHVMAGESNVFAAWQQPFASAMKIIDENGAHNAAEYWPYGNIRSCNEIIQIKANGCANRNAHNRPNLRIRIPPPAPNQNKRYLRNSLKYLASN